MGAFLSERSWYTVPVLLFCTFFIAMEVLSELGMVLGLVVGISFLMQVFRLPLLLGYLLAGFLAGPAMWGILHSPESFELFSQLGITALLFIVGLGLNPSVIREVGKTSFYAGVGQILVTTVLGYGLTRLFGWEVRTAWFLAIGFTFSSTIIVMKLLGDRQDLGRLYAKISIGLLLIQDLVATVILVAVTAFTQSAVSSGLFFTLIGRFIALIAGLVLFAYFILPRLTRFFAASQEFLLVFVVGWGIGIAVLFAKLGLSVEIGALAAGVSLASSSYRYEMTAKMKLLRDFFLILFFVLLGSHLELSQVQALWPQALFFSLFVLVINPIIIWAIMGVLGYTKRTSFMTGLSVAQISEFSLLLLLLVSKAGIVSSQALPLMMMVGVITFASSTLLIQQADPIFKVLSPLLAIFERRNPQKEHRIRERYDALLFGCHRVGEDFVNTFKKRKLSFLIVDFDPQVIATLEEKKIPCRYGDAYDNELMEELDFAHVKLVVCTIPDHETNVFLLAKCRRVNKAATIILTAHSVPEAQALYKGGAAYVIMPHYLGGNHAAMLVEKHGHSRIRFSHERKQHLLHLAERMK